MAISVSNSPALAGPAPGLAPNTGTPPAETHVADVVAVYRFANRNPRLGPPPEWTVPEPFRRTLDPAIVVAVRTLDGPASIPFALRVSASEVKSAPRNGEPAPVYHWSRGSVYTTLDAPPYHGRILRVMAKVRLANLFAGRTRRSPARFWVRVDGPDPSAVPLVHEDSANEITAAWREISIDVPVFGHAEHVHFGVDVRAGAVDVAEVRVVDLGPSGIDPPTPLSGLEVDRLVVLARLLGYVRFFHPSNEAAEVDWDAFTIDAIETVLAMTGPGSDPPSGASLESTLRGIFAPIAPTVAIGGETAAPGSIRMDDGGGRPAGALQMVRWNHYGLGVFPGDHPYRSSRVEIRLPAADVDGVTTRPGAERPDPETRPMDPADPGGPTDPIDGTPILTNYETTIRSGPFEIPVSVPLLLYSGTNGTIPLAPTRPRDIRRVRTKPYGFLPVPEDRTTRLAAGITLWNVAQHFYPNFDEIECDWPGVLPWALEECATAPDRDAFASALERMLVPLQDGHGGVYPFYSNDSGRLPFEIAVIDGRAWVTGVDPALRSAGSRAGSDTGSDGRSAAGSATGAGQARSAGRIPEIGDQLVAIDGIPIPTLLNALGSRVSAATAGSHRARTRERMLHGRIGEMRRCTFGSERSPGTFSASVALVPEEASRLRIAESHRPRIADLGHGILYLDARRIDDVSFRGSLPALVQARGVVVDCRGYPEGLSPRWLEHWLTGPARSPRWNVPVDRAPDRTARNYAVRDWEIEPQEPRITAPTVFLTDADAISRAETYLSIVQHAGIGQIVGGTTAGTNGNILPFTLPGGLRVTITGMKVRTQDGEPFHGIGVVPDVPIEPTIRGIREGRDEVLDRGIAILRSR